LALRNYAKTAKLIVEMFSPLDSPIILNFLKTKHYWGTGVVCFTFFFWLRVLDKAEYSAFESTLNSPIVSYRIANSTNYPY